MARYNYSQGAGNVVQLTALGGQYGGGYGAIAGAVVGIGVEAYNAQIAKSLARQGASAMRAYAHAIRQLRDEQGRQFGLVQAQQFTEQAAQRFYAPVLTAPGVEALEVPAPFDPYATIAGASKRQIRRAGAVGRAAAAEFGSVKKAAQALRFRAAPTATQIGVPRYGINNPVLRGSRDDPEGAIRPRFASPFPSHFRR